MTMKSYIFWDMTARSPMKVDRRFGGIYSLHLQGRRVSQVRNHHDAGNRQGKPDVKTTALYRLAGLQVPPQAYIRV
jgi:hypothetical protein